jgi:tRNA-intron endonuclease
MVFREHDSITIGGLHEEYMRRKNMRMGLLAAVVDGDFDITYYSVTASLVDGPGPLDHRSIRFDKEEGAEVPGGGLLAFKGDIARAGTEEGLGTDLNGTMAFSTEESSYLTGNPRIGRLENIKDTVYRDLRSRGYIVRTGFKYGSHFRIYSSGCIDDHSDLLVHCTESDADHTWEVLARAIRLSHSVRKRMLFACVTGVDSVSYLELNWTRP